MNQEWPKNDKARANETNFQTGNQKSQDNNFYFLMEQTLNGKMSILWKLAFLLLAFIATFN